VHVGRMGDLRGLYRVLVVKSEGRRPQGKTTRKWLDNIRMDLQEVRYGIDGLDWAGPG